MGAQSPRAVVLDAGALIAFERANPFVRQLLREALRLRALMLLPAPVLAQVWREPARQAPISALVKRVQVVAMDETWAKACGALLSKRGGADTTDAMVVLLARKHAAAIITSDPGDLSRLDPGAKLFQV